ncbi:Hypothetical protein CINCED_3A007428 [Cinara cedri]|uniref:Uncharacterized protein n=1 Tax=Cinara cedri TaxID=506608 RepID=A0A5E4M5P3_9HEMI|nr:Hypothetical protein CINCED_3A007428 [Cinara cedri]
MVCTGPAPISSDFLRCISGPTVGIDETYHVQTAGGKYNRLRKTGLRTIAVSPRFVNNIALRRSARVETVKNKIKKNGRTLFYENLLSSHSRVRDTGRTGANPLATRETRHLVWALSSQFPVGNINPPVVGSRLTPAYGPNGRSTEQSKSTMTIFGTFFFSIIILSNVTFPFVFPSDLRDCTHTQFSNRATALQFAGASVRVPAHTARARVFNAVLTRSCRLAEPFFPGTGELLRYGLVTSGDSIVTRT